MGKKIIIKGADFSENGMLAGELVWYFEKGFDKAIYNVSKTGSSAWALTDTEASILYGKTINRIKFIPAATGTFRIYKTSSLSSLGELVAEVAIDASLVRTVVTASFDDVVVANGERFVFPDNMPYVAETDASFYKRVGYSDYSVVSDFRFPWAFGYYVINSQSN